MSTAALELVDFDPDLRAMAHETAMEQLAAVRHLETADQRQRAREDYNAFVEYCFEDPHTRQPIRQARVHRAMWDHLSQHRRAVCKFPVEHGKTSQAIFILLRLLGQHPDRCYAYVQAKAANAYKVIGAIKREIESNARLREVYPDLQPDTSRISQAMELWGTTKLRVRGAPPGSKDPSLEAFGLDGQILGARLHGIILDNMLTRANTASRDMRQKVLELIDNEILTRNLAGGFVWILDTTWYKDDAVETIARRPGWSAITFDAMQGLDPEDVTLWPSQFPPERLDSIRRTMPETSFNRMYRNKPLSETMGLFRDEVLDPCWGIVPWCDSWSPELEWTNGNRQEVKVCTGVDLATRKGEEHDLTVLCTGVRIGTQYRLLNLEADRLHGTEIARRIVSHYQRFHKGADSSEIRVEDNGAQKYIIDMLRDASIMRPLGLTEREIDSIYVTGHTTTSRKRDLELGVPGLAGDFEMGRMMIPDHTETDFLRDELQCWTPDGHTGDRVMALWIMREGLRPNEPNVIVV